MATHASRAAHGAGIDQGFPPRPGDRARTGQIVVFRRDGWAPTLTGVAKFRTAGRLLSPTTFILAGVCFALPFVTVGCDTPGGYGRAAPGGTTSYSGVDLAVGGRPDISPPDKLRPVAEQRDDRLPPQPTALIVLVLIAAGTGAAITIEDRRTRRGAVALISGGTATALLVNQALAQSDVTLRVGREVSIASPGADPGKYVHTGVGFGVCLVLLVLMAVVTAIGWWIARPRIALVDPEAETVPNPL
jgi:hypothetical protein